MGSERAAPSFRPPAAPAPAAADGLPCWWSEAAAHASDEEGAAWASGAGSSASAAAAEQAATLLRVIVNVRISGREPRVRAALTQGASK